MIPSSAEFRRYDLYGLELWSELPLPAPAQDEKRAGSHRIEVRWGGARSVPAQMPEGEVLSRLLIDENLGTVAVRRSDGFLLRYFGLCEFQVSPDLTQITAHPDPGNGVSYAPLLLAGNVMAFVLAMLGRTVLHASAVEDGGRVIAFVGASGQGKSTVAAMCCGSGARLVTDDLLALKIVAGRFECPRGPAELRLRQQARELSALWPDGDLPKTTADDRHIARPAASAAEQLGLNTIVLPRPRRDIADIKLTRLSSKSAFQGIAGHSRWGSWVNKEVLSRDTQLLARLVREIPVYEAEIPWVPPYRKEIADELLRLLALTPADTRTESG